jgi:hypothetical protein
MRLHMGKLISCSAFGGLVGLVAGPVIALGLSPLLMLLASKLFEVEGHGIQTQLVLRPMTILRCSSIVLTQTPHMCTFAQRA